MTDLLNNENISDIDCLRLVMLYALRYEKESPVQLMQLFNKLASRSPKYKPGVMYASNKWGPFSYMILLLFDIFSLSIGFLDIQQLPRALSGKKFTGFC